MALLLAPPWSLTQGASDVALKARLALAVARFAEMPAPRAPRPLRLCVAVGGPPPSAFMALAQQRIGTREVEVVASQPFNACDVLYVDASFGEWRRLLAVAAPALTVGDVPGFLAAGGMIELVIENDALRFDVSLPALRAQQIRLPAQVLKLARQVQE